MGRVRRRGVGHREEFLRNFLRRRDVDGDQRRAPGPRLEAGQQDRRVRVLGGLGGRQTREVDGPDDGEGCVAEARGLGRDLGERSSRRPRRDGRPPRGPAACGPNFVEPAGTADRAGAAAGRGGPEICSGHGHAASPHAAGSGRMKPARRADVPAPAAPPPAGGSADRPEHPRRCAVAQGNTAIRRKRNDRTPQSRRPGRRRARGPVSRRPSWQGNSMEQSARQHRRAHGGCM